MDSEKLKIVKDALKSVKMHSIDSLPVKRELGPISLTSKNLPSFNLDVKDAPFLKGYQVGDECMIIVKTKICSHHAHDSSDGDSKDCYGLEVLSAGQISHKPVGGKEEPGY